MEYPFQVSTKEIPGLNSTDLPPAFWLWVVLLSSNQILNPLWAQFLTLFSRFLNFHSIDKVQLSSMPMTSSFKNFVQFHFQSQCDHLPRISRSSETTDVIDCVVYIFVSSNCLLELTGNHFLEMTVRFLEYFN